MRGVYLSHQVPCWLRPRDRTRSPEVLSNMSRPTTLPLRIPPRISITQADADRFTNKCIFLFFSFNHGFHLKQALQDISYLPSLIIFYYVAVMKQKMACPQVTPLWALRVQASPCIPHSLRARGENPSCTALIRTMTCHQRPCLVTLPLPAKGENQKVI